MSGPARKPRRARRRSGRGALIVVTLMLATSGVIRLVEGSGQVFANDADALDLPEVEAPEMAMADGVCAPAPDIAAVIEALDQREARLAEREAALADWSSALKLAETEVRENLAALEAAEVRLKDLVALSDEAAKSDLDRLTAVYEAMKPKDASAMFERMPPEFAAGFLGRMRPERAAEIMEGLDPETANVISLLVAGRNAGAPSE